MADDYGSRYTSAYPFPLSANSSRLYSGSLSGSIGPDDTSDEDWFKIPMLKGATYQLQVIGGPEVYDLNDAKITWYKPNGSSTIANWYYDQARSDGYVYDSGIITTSEVGKTDDYYIKVDLDPYGDDLDVGEYDIRVEQLSEGFTTYLTQSLASTMTDDYGSRYTSAYTFPLSANASGLASGSLTGVIGPDDNNDEDWFKVRLLKGATYEFTVAGGSEVYDLNDSKITWYKPNGSSTIANWYFDQSRDDGYVYDEGIYTTSPISSTDDYYIKVDLDPYGDSLDVGQYTMSVEQLTPGFINNSFELRSVSIDLSTAITDNSKKNETVEGTSNRDLIADGRGKDTLIGGAGADQFYFSGEEPFKKNTVDKVGDFSAEDGDSLVIAEDIVVNPLVTNQVINDLSNKPNVGVASNKKELGQLSKDDHDFIYYKPKGEFYVDDNDDSKGLASKGDDPLLAKVDRNTELTQTVIDDIVDDLKKGPELAVVDSKKDLKKASKDGHDLIYFEPSGDLYIDGNGDSKGFGKKTEGGLLVDLPKDTVLTESDILIGE